MIKKSKKNNNKSIILLTVLSYLAGYLIHNSLEKVYEFQAAGRVNNCITTTKDIYICMPYYNPRGWEKLVRF